MNLNPYFLNFLLETKLKKNSNVVSNVDFNVIPQFQLAKIIIL